MGTDLLSGRVQLAATQPETLQCRPQRTCVCKRQCQILAFVYDNILHFVPCQQGTLHDVPAGSQHLERMSVANHIA